MSLVWTVLALGRGMPEGAAALFVDYRQRLKRFGELRLIEVAEHPRREEGAAARELALLKEWERLEPLLPPGAPVVALDLEGKPLTSLQWAQALERHRREGARHLCFLIGGPDGLHAHALARSDWRLSLGAMTFPHLLVRVLLAEQLYRAMTILHKVPYHR
ncbi:MAG: 23S rRNA (pseudouridine(1915)-N(3))-methyltransferase RlmH [Magnetococcales bacterium]|nr:23S rRNA (pseudouridine(1915)-N(3))-methyltransferase RlmH [Magnetococcales bacterium]